MSIIFVYLSYFLMTTNLVFCQIAQPVDPNELPEGMDRENVPPGMKKWTFQTPTLSEEEKESIFFPAKLKCDGCRAVTYKLYTKFYKLYTKYKSTKGKLKESELLSEFEEVCSAKNDEYALKDIDGNLRMVGPGLEIKEDQPGIIQGGGKMPTRMRQLCHTLRGEIGEEEIYNQFLIKPENRMFLELFLCHNNEQSLTSYCVHKDKKDEL